MQLNKLINKINLFRTCNYKNAALTTVPTVVITVTQKHNRNTKQTKMMLIYSFLFCMDHQRFSSVVCEHENVNLSAKPNHSWPNVEVSRSEHKFCTRLKIQLFCVCLKYIDETMPDKSGTRKNEKSSAGVKKRGRPKKNANEMNLLNISLNVAVNNSPSKEHGDKSKSVPSTQNGKSNNKPIENKCNEINYFIL